METQVHNDLPYWLALWRTPELGPVRFAAIYQVFPRLSDFFSQVATHTSLPKVAQDYLKNPDWAAVEQDLAWVEHSCHHIVTWQDRHYPALLREIATAPPILFVQGDPTVLASPQIAIVGSRHPTPIGLDNASAFARHVASAGYTITSGLALGVDGACHRGALSVQGMTVAVMGAGLDRLYPARHQALAEQIVAAGGALVSEFPLGSGPKAEHFPRRNRVISGLSMGVLVVEAAVSSGSLITARYAMEQGREVFAIPGSIHNPLARGCHALIRQGATLVETYDDIVKELNGLLQWVKPQQEQDSLKQKVLAAIDDAPTAIDVLLARTGITVPVISSLLLELELSGLVSMGVGGYQRKPCTPCEYHEY